MNANNRYKIICSKNINIRSVHSNVLMECYLLSWDQLTKKSILQIKFRNLEIKTIKSIHILYYTVDLDGNINTDPCFTTYQDLNAEPNSSFGSKIPIVIDSELIGDVKIFINKIIWDDNVLQEIPQESYTEIQPQEPIESLLDEQQCAHYQTLCNLPSVPKYYPLKVDETLWRCTCGSFSNSDICYNCSAYKNDIFSYCDSNYLINYSQNLQAAQNKKHKRKKQALILTSCLIVISISIGLLWNAFLKDFYYTGRAIMNIKDFSDEGEETYYDYLFKIENIPLYFYLEDKRDAAFKKKKAALHATSKIINQDRYVDLFQFALNTGILICEDGNSVIFSSCSDLNTYTDIWGENLKGWNNIVKVIESNLFGTVAITKKHKVISSLANIEDDYRFEYVKQIESLKSIKDIYQYDGWFGFSGALIALHDDGSVSLIPGSYMEGDKERVEQFCDSLTALKDVKKMEVKQSTIIVLFQDGTLKQVQGESITFPESFMHIKDLFVSYDTNNIYALNNDSNVMVYDRHNQTTSIMLIEKPVLYFEEQYAVTATEKINLLSPDEILLPNEKIQYIGGCKYKLQADGSLSKCLEHDAMPYSAAKLRK